jgi:dolichol kinase
MLLKVTACLSGIAAILIFAEVLWRKKTLNGEYARKLVHILAGIFVASWPWLISWRAIQLLGLAILAGVLVNNKLKILHAINGLRTKFYSHCYYAVAITVCAAITTQKAFFAVAILTMALADGFAAIAGCAAGENWRYKIFGQTKTIIGSMIFWLTALCVLGTGVVLISNTVDFAHYQLLIIFLPPVLTVLENVAIYGTDNMVIPVAMIIALNLAR